MPFAALRARRYKTWLLVCAAALVAVAALGVVLTRGQPSAEELTQVNEEALGRQLLSLRDERGLLVNPPQFQPARLDTTGWLGLLRSELATPQTGTPDRGVLEKLAAVSGEDPVWAAFYMHAAGVEPSAATQAGVLRERSASGAFAVRRPAGAPPDRASDVLRTWAAVQVIASGEGRTMLPLSVTWAAGILGQCRDNSFVRYHLYDALRTADPAAEPRWAQLLGDCPDTIRLPDATAPRTEAELLTAVGAAQLLRVTKRDVGFGTSRTRLRNFLSPQPFMRYDPWWSYYAASGFTAAGGPAAAYADTIKALEGLADRNGLIQAVDTPSSSPQVMYFELLTAASTGQDLLKLVDPNALHAMRREASGWQDADLALWGEMLYLIGRPPVAAEAAEVQRAARRCAEQTPSMAVVRITGICKSAARHYGADVTGQSPGVTTLNGLTPEAIVDFTATWGEAADPATVLVAVHKVLRSGRKAPTSVLAGAAAAARLAGKPLSDGEIESLREELTRRRAPAPFDQFFVELHDARSADVRATAMVYAAHGRLR